MKIPLHPGDQLDHYRIDAIADRHGPASVFRGTDLQSNRPVAIKVPDFDMESDPVAFERFQREEEIGKSLDHPGFLKLFADEHRSQTYMVSEWFDGFTLRSLLTDQPLLKEQAVNIAFKVAEALAYLHNHGVVHRDLRPENILVDRQNNIKLVNFGAAAKAGARRITFTSLAQVVGFSDYISPEELNGKRGDARSDIFALGVILYQMLTGKLPFDSAGSYERLTKDPPPPRKLNPMITPGLQEVIYRAIERQPKHRYANATDFGRDLTDSERMKIVERPSDVSRARSKTLWRKSGIYIGTAAIPVVIFLLLLYFARN